MAIRRAFVAILCIAQVASCSLVLEPGALDEGCSDQTKPCFGKCVSKMDPAYGCGRASCAPCGLLNGTANCSAELICGVSSCTEPFDDCDKLAYNGCEANKDEDVHNCGGCGYDYDCERKVGPHVKDVRCGAHVCYIYQCDPGFAPGTLESGCTPIDTTNAEDAGADAG